MLEHNEEHLSLIPLRRNPSMERVRDRILRDNLKALVSVLYVDRPFFRYLEQNGVPVVIIGDLEHQDLFSGVGIDDFRGSLEATQYLISLGHRRIAYLDYPRDQQPSLVKWRHLGYKMALADAGLQPDPRLHVRVPEDDADLLAEALTALFTIPSPPTALFSHDDYFLMRALPRIEQLGLRVPHDVSVIAHGDQLDYAQEYNRKITTMQIDWSQLGKLAAEMLIERLRGRLNRIQVIRLNERIVDRNSCMQICADQPVAT